MLIMLDMPLQRQGSDEKCSLHPCKKVISLRLIIIRNGEDMLLINFPLDKLSSVLADTGQIPDSLSHLGPFKEDVSSIVLIKKNMSPLLSIAFNHLISYQNVVFSLPVGISALGKSIRRTTSISPQSKSMHSSRGS